MSFHDIAQDILLPAAAVYGVVVSSLVLVWDIMKWRKEKADDKVKLAVEVEFSEAQSPTSGMERILNIKVTNVGKKPTTINSLRVRSGTMLSTSRPS